MKIVLDLTELVERGALAPDEAVRLKSLAAFTAQSLAVNILVGFGLAAVVASVGVLLPSAITAVVLGVIGMATGVALLRFGGRGRDLLGHLCAVAGTLVLCGGVTVLDDGSLRSVLLDVAIALAAGVALRSGLLVAVAVLGIGACLGSSTDYRHALYSVSVEEPALTVLVFSAIALLAYLISLRVTAAYERLALIAARLAVLSVNFGFWVGSLWGDDLDWTHRGAAAALTDGAQDGHPLVPAGAFGLAWAVALVAVATWAFRAHRLWIVNTAAVFGAIHFYTQWFERLGAQPVAVLIAGLTTLGFALLLWRLNQASGHEDLTR